MRACLQTWLAWSTLWVFALSVDAPAAGTHRAIVVRQQVDAGGRSSIVLQSTLLVSSAVGLDAARFATTVPTPDGFAGFLMPGIPADALGSEVVARAAAAIDRQRMSVAEALAQFMRGRGDSAGWYTLDQTVRLGGRDRHLVWTAHLDQQGRALYGAPQLVDDRPALLYVRYVPLRLRAGLPTEWRYPGAGKLTWQMRSLEDGTALSDWQQRDVAGVFDAPAGGTVDPEFGLRCLLGSQLQGCPPRQIDVRRLIDATGAVAAMVDYVRAMQPEFTVMADGQRVATAAVDVYRRSVRHAPCGRDCAAVFSNAYRIGYRLALAADRVMARPDGSWTPVAHYTTYSVSPTQDTARQMALTAAQARDLQGKMIRPDSGALIDVAAMPPGMIVSLATLTDE